MLGLSEIVKAMPCNRLKEIEVWSIDPLRD
jgi:hypothetical protein